MSKIRKIISCVLVVATLLPCFALVAGAKNVCKEVSGKSSWNGGVNTVFYVTTSNTKKHYVQMKMTKGRIQQESVWAQLDTDKIYDYYEILVYGKQKNGQYTQISKANVKDKSSYKIYFSGYTDYKIKVYSWKVDTINEVGKYIMNPFMGWTDTLDAEWDTNCLPTWKISKTSGVTLCR